MTVSDDFIPGDPNFEEAPTYPVIFGIALTPVVSGVLLAIVGIGAATYLFLNFVQPEWEKNQSLEQKVTEKKDQVSRQAAIIKEIEKAQADLETATKQQSEVLSLFASDATLNTLLLDFNRQVDQANGGVSQARQSKLAACPAWVRANLKEIETQYGDLAARAKLKQFIPDDKASGIINDGSYGTLVNNKLKRQVATLSFEGNYNQTQSIMRSVERLQPLLVFKGFELTQEVNKVGGQPLVDPQGNNIRFLPNCQPDTRLTTKFQMEALQPLNDVDRAKIVPSPAATPPPKK